MRTNKYLFVLLVVITNSNSIRCAEDSVSIDESKTIVWGPGLDPENIILRARYIFLQLVDEQGKNVTKSPGKSLVTARITGTTEQGDPCPIWTQIFDCKDGSFIVRYKIFNTCFNFRILLLVKNRVLSLKRNDFKGPIHEEECYCPNPLVHIWLENNECLPSHRQISRDLATFPSVDFDDLRNKIVDKFNKPNSISVCHYVIKDNKIYRKCYGQHVGFKIFTDTILLSLTRKTVLPDVEFFMNLGDWPLVSEKKDILPIFSWCGSEGFKDIVLPTWDLTESSIEAMGRVMLDMVSVQGNTNSSWNEKIPKMFWRGRDSRRERLDLIDIARNNPDLFNASITNFFFFRNEMAKYGPGEKHTSFFDFFEYKYQLNIDGTVAAYRFPYLLAGDCLVFKQNSKYYEFFYEDVEPFKHYVPVKSDLSDLVEKIKWAMENDAEAFKITKEARLFARNNLMPQNVFCYYVALLYEWSKRLKSTVQVLPEMEQVFQPEHKCKCITNEKGNKDEL
ncbi:KDEL motif-containing protein 1 [Copidosoma floridanum]|uniref:KDEL motif-containing protein 1 n=1 Tax=Copidosoma floridanum TaxID=29053 RepID=UPI0006C9B452|nr:KDEL motif-containing protein 1 [Copidosoma floridanum]